MLELKEVGGKKGRKCDGVRVWGSSLSSQPFFPFIYFPFLKLSWDKIKKKKKKKIKRNQERRRQFPVLERRQLKGTKKGRKNPFFRFNIFFLTLWRGNGTQEMPGWKEGINGGGKKGSSNIHTQ